MKRFAQLLSISVFLLQTCLVVGQNNVERFTNFLSDSEITANATLVVTDDKLEDDTEWAKINENLSAKCIVLLEIDQDDLSIQSGPIQQFSIDLEVRYWNKEDDEVANGGNANGVFEDAEASEVDNITLAFDYNSEPTSVTTSKAFHLKEDFHKMKVEILTINQRGSAALKLSGDIIIERIYDFDTNAYPNITSSFLSPMSDDLLLQFDNPTITWDAFAGAQEYDLEWTFYDELSVVGANIDNANENFNYNDLFKNNATRITTTEQSFKIQKLYPKGYILYRLRAAQYNKKGHRITTDWTSAEYDPSTAPLTDFNEKIFVAWHEEKLNWQAQVNYAEEAKHVPSVKYFDGSLRHRQTVTRSNSENMTIAEEVLYDYHGRPTVTTMPAPTFLSNISYIDRLSKPKFLDPGEYPDAPYNKAHFDDFDFSSPTSSSAPGPMSDEVGAGKYYSSNNDRNIADDFHQYVPGAEDYPFSIVEYTPDMTGRIRRQSGVGKAFRRKGGHETFYYYGKPAQEELDRLFGNEVGYASHYQKNMVIDPNGQVSVSYVDAHGRTIATALAGDTPKVEGSDPEENMLDPLGSNTGGVSLTRDILNNIPGTLESSFVLTVSSEGLHTFSYNSGMASYSPECTDPNDPNSNVEYCYDCKYDLKIEIISNDLNGFNNGLSSYTVEESNVDLSQALADCSDESTLIPNFDQLNLPVGEYQIRKTLSISQENLEAYLEDFLSKDNCLPSYEDLRTEAINELDLNACNVEEEESLDRCAAMLVHMKGDMSPRGQYGEVDDDNLSAWGNSIFNDERLNLSDENPMTSNLYKIALKLQACGKIVNVRIDEVQFSPIDIVKVTLEAVGEEYNLLEELIKTNWDTDWANCLVEIHPEYCRYQWCNANVVSNTHDEDLRNTDTYNEALTAGLILGCSTGESATAVLDPSCGIPLLLIDDMDNIIDPFFNDPCRDDLKMTMMERLGMLNLTEECSSVSIVEIAQAAAYCDGDLPCDVQPGAGCSASNDLFWQIYRNLYLGLKYQLQSQVVEEGVLAGSITDCTTGSTFACNPSDLDITITTERFPIINELAEPISEEELENKKMETEGELTDYCEDVCSNQADAWIAKLQDCLSEITDEAVRNQAITDLKAGFIEVCKAGCDVDHPFGASSTKDGVSVSANGTTYITFQDVINDILSNEVMNCDADCNADLIDFPVAYEQADKAFFGALEPAFRKDVTREGSDENCMCTQLKELEEAFNTEMTNASTSATTLVEYINKLGLSDTELTQDMLSKIQSYCNLNTTCVTMPNISCTNTTNSCSVLPQDIILPPYLECDVCIDCENINTLLTSFELTCSATLGTQEHSLLRAQYLNKELGFTLSAEEYDEFIGSGTSITCPTDDALLPTKRLCPQSAFGNYEVPDAEADCKAALEYQAEVNALQAYNAAYEALKTKFTQEYLATCLNDLNGESFTVTGDINEYHYTLYYYDQAGNLVKTVPPNGVMPLTGGSLNEVHAHREGTLPNPVYPSHTYLTQYRYNSLNEVVRQDSPDAYTSTTNDKEGSEMWYDRVGRPVISQDGRQRPNNWYSYTLYDRQGRITEVGEIESTTPMTVTLARDEDDLEEWINVTNANNKTFVTRTFYDQEAEQSNGDFLFDLENTLPEGQEFLRPRVSSTYKDEDGDGAPEYATHYSYDASGNVKTLIQEIDALKELWHSQKRIDYDYDYISGNVNAVYYQAGQVDQFSHRYQYDDNNRLTEVQTSYIETHIEDSPFWEKEATYDYYLHGPLARMEVGEQRVQGTDYAYTLQGWIKGINRNVIDPSTSTVEDIGNDGSSVTTPAIDIMSYTLSYYAETNQEDYMSISGYRLSDLATLSIYNTPSLYNGNIALMETDIPDDVVAYNYRYDQLHRIKEMKGTKVRASGFGGNLYVTNRFNTSYNYDANGNLQMLKRYDGDDNGAVLIDDLTYNYTSGTNLLTSVDDAIADNLSLRNNEVKDQEDNNYRYDGAGNLKQDLEGKIVNINWTPYGKVKHLEFEQATLRTTKFGYDAAQNRIMKNVGVEGNIPDPGGSYIDIQNTTYYIRDAQGNILATYTRFYNYNETIEDDEFFVLPEHHIYGSSRLGIAQTGIIFQSIGGEINDVNVSDENSPFYLGSKQLKLGSKRYECTNHLGNVLAVVSDRREGVDTDENSEIDHYEPVLISAQDYYPFGMEMPNRSYTLAGGEWEYRFGFNGKEADKNIYWGGPTHYDYGFRIYNPGIGRFLSVDPLTASYPSWTPYAFAMNRVIDGIDLDGLEYANSTGNIGPVSDNYLLNPPETTYEEYDVNNNNMLDAYLPAIEITTQGAKPTGGRTVEFITDASSRNVLQGSYTGWLRIQYQGRVAALEPLLHAGSKSNPGPWVEGLDQRYYIKSQTRNWMLPTPSMKYAMNNAHNPDKYLGPFKRFATDAFEVKHLTLDNPDVQARINETGRPQNFSKSNKFFNGMGKASAGMAAFGAGVSAHNIVTADNKLQQTTIEATKWGSAWLGAEIFGMGCAAVCPHPIAVGGAAIIGGVVGGTLGEEGIKNLLGKED